jgi:acyl-coenzyme A synthetase/AMP-(fatty) acid ligase
MAEALVRTFDAGEGSRVLAFASAAFDASLFEIFMALASGGALDVASEEERASGAALLRGLWARAVTHVALIPSVLSSMPDGELPALRVVVSAGEPCSAALVARWARGRRMFNVYGPTEASVWATLHACRDERDAPPIGRPIASMRAHVLDAALAPVPEGGVGELFLAGVGLADGYLNRPELTQERFITGPVRGEDGRPERLYRTGDLVRVLPGGDLAFAGRVDRQVKVRGFRVELDAVEAAVLDHPAVLEAAVVVRERGEHERHLVCYAAPRPGHGLDATALRDFLGARTPAYMVPSVFHVMDALPRLPNGKLDHAALPASLPGRPGAALPEGATAQALVAIWCEVLGIASVGAHDDVFELGADSLIVNRVLARIEARLGAEL